MAKRIRHTGLERAVIGVSGGLDSTLALLVTAKAFDLLDIPRKNILAITMPGFGTTDVTYTNAMEFMKSMDVEIREINIKDACLQHFKDIGHDPAIHDVTYENVQARERTQILMDIANKEGGLVIGTGDLSELALGWCTYNGDHMSMYAVNASIPKTLVSFLVKWVADNMLESKAKEVLYRILNTPISPELLPPDAKVKSTKKRRTL
ncbi:NAD synthetase [Acetivibrio straminisolvens JCM 21531]|uniref:NH(3)-dependent NAD(+) synthetase n=1 Tax=Acetivibrio straminisolvens JCM 21531 TaxID=1294263 RepID=W4V824_9FIRM|nr:NAD synthetase [Acetivibrio straminisolvens JCM 21531]